MRALVITVVHHPEDSRIRHRQIVALLEAGWEVTYGAPFNAYGVLANGDSGLEQLDLPRAMGRRRLRALRAARQLLRQRGPAHDVVLLHDPELLAALPGIALPPVVWDVHEDTAAAMTLKPWLPRPLRPAVSWSFKRFERFVERRVDLILAEHAYQDRFRRTHPVVPNVNVVPAAVAAPDEPRVVYVGSVTRARGAVELLKVAKRITPETAGRLKLTVIGPAAPDVSGLLQSAVEAGVLDWPGFLPSAQALAQVEGSIAGVSLLHDEPNYRVSLPTKVVEYMARGVPVVTTPLPLAAKLVDETGCGIVVPFGDPDAAAGAILDLWADPERRRAMGKAGHQAALERFDWRQHADNFVAMLERVAER